MLTKDILVSNIIHGNVMSNIIHREAMLNYTVFYVVLIEVSTTFMWIIYQQKNHR